MADKTASQAMHDHLIQIQELLNRLQEKVDYYEDQKNVAWDQVGDMGYLKSELANAVKFVRA